MFVSVKPYTVYSGALDARRTLYVYTPPGYETSDQSYPVLYLLHGMWGSETDWLYQGDAERTLDTMIADGSLPPTIVVFPNDGQYSSGTWYVDWYDGSGNFESYFIDDIVPFIDKTFRTCREPQYRAIAGLSMGGFGAVMLALRNPTLWGIAGSLSGAVGEASSNEQAAFARVIGPTAGSYAQRYALRLLAQERLIDGVAPKLHVNCGVGDFLIQDNRKFHQYLVEIGYDHQYEEFPGEHTWPYWTDHLPDVCRFVSRCFA